ncbi:hypothetical protein BDP27DRAFT_1234902, partial [Rhodocollybia butyracea]
LKTQRAALLSLLSPIRKLPNETLSRIFKHVCEENLLQCNPWLEEEDNPPTDITSPVITHLPAMAVGSVCSRWRALALSSPSLWENLAVETHTAGWGDGENFKGFTDAVKLYLQRSGDLPLRLALTIYGFFISKAVPGLEHLTQHAYGWKTFKFRGIETLFNYRMSERHFPSLVDLDICRHSALYLSCFYDCPKLVSLSLSGHVRPRPETDLMDPVSIVYHSQISLKLKITSSLPLSEKSRVGLYELCRSGRGRHTGAMA